MTRESDQACPPLSEAERTTLLRLARQSIAAALAKRASPKIADPPARLRQPGGVFVSLHLNGELRGCIGTIKSHDPLWRSVVRMAVAAAFDDPRFPPLTADDIEQVHIEISRLSQPRPTLPDRIVPDSHGVWLLHGAQRAVFLPQVAAAHGWDRLRLLEELCLKASLPRDAWRDPEATLFTFEAEVFAEEG